MTNLCTRIAPTPSGWLHPGNGVSFLITWALARAMHAELWLRIDDLDDARMRPEYITDIFRTLDWLGIDFDRGPTGPDEFFKRFSQHLRLDLYQKNLEKLRQAGHLYVCECSRKEIREQSADGLYPGTCRNKRLPWNTPNTAQRIRVPAGTIAVFHEWDPGNRQLPAGPPTPPGSLAGDINIPTNSLDLSAAMGDFVLLQKNGLPAYQIASLTDDLLWGINLIVRGEDLLASTAAQIYLAQCLDEQAFLQAKFLHHPLILDERGEKLSKSQGAGALRTWRENGMTPAKLVQQAAGWLGIESMGIETAGDLLTALQEK